MKKSIKFTILTLISLFMICRGTAQENFASHVVTNVSDGEKLLISYDLVAPGEGGLFTVVLFATHSGAQVKTTSAYGDLGNGINPGTEKAIVWYFKDDFSGNISDVKVEVFAYKENEPQAIFDIVSLSNNGYAPCEVTFTNKSVYTNEYQWNFGDQSSGAANLSFEKEPKHVYQKGGVYTISLIARNSQTKLENVYYQSIQVKEYDPVVAGFEIDGNNQTAPATVKLKSTSANVDKYLWDFGDPSLKKKNSSDKESPSVTYKKPGTYRVKLVVKNNQSGLSDEITQDVIVESKQEATASFIYTKSSETAPSMVTFKNTSAAANRYEWNFGDSSSGTKNSSSEENPVHFFEKPGNFKVQLSVWAQGAKKPKTFSEVVKIEDLPQPPEANFVIQNNNVIGPVSVTFINNSLNSTSFSWDFGDPESGSSNTSKKKDPVHTYKNPGRYEVVLTASSPGFSRDSRHSDWVVITSPESPVLATVAEARFSTESDSYTAPAVVNFTNYSVNADAFLWDFGDKNSQENSSELKNPTHIYSREGRYQVKLSAKNSSTGQSAEFVDFVEVSGKPIPEPVVTPVVEPVAAFDFSFDQNTEGKVVFSNSSQNADEYEWNFGDPASGNLNSSAERNPEHTYARSGEYKVMLYVKSSGTGKEKIIEKKVSVTIKSAPPVADFEMKYDPSKIPAQVEFRNLTTNADTYSWNFGDFSSDDNESNSASPFHTYLSPGKYTVTLNAINSATGDSRQVSKEVILKSNVSVFVKEGFGKNTESVVSLLNLSKNEFLAVMKKSNNKSLLAKINDSGNVTQEKEFDELISGVVPLPGDKFMISGIDLSGKLFVMIVDSKLKNDSPIVFPADKSYKTDYFYPEIALSVAGEAGVIANTINDRYPLDLFFQKTDLSGRIIPVTDRTFKFIGLKTVTAIVPMRNGGFALTGYWQEKQQSQMSMLFAKIDRKGVGDMQLITSAVNMFGCSILESFQDGFALLRAEDLQRNGMYEISFALVKGNGEATDCEHILPCAIKKDDLLKFKPTMIKTDNEYVVASHCFNGVDYDISLCWIDRTGKDMFRYETLTLPGDQFVMDLVQTEDGGILVAGTQEKGGKKEPFIIKTDPWGKIVQ